MNRHHRITHLSYLLIVALFSFGGMSACSESNTQSTNTPADPVPNTGNEPPISANFDMDPGVSKNEGADGKAEAWGREDSPFRFDSNLVLVYADLPKSGHTETAPWAANYWPVYKDSINDLWDGPDSKSPAQKFEDAFGLADIEDAVSQHHGIESQSHRTACTTNDECDAEMAEKCAKRVGSENGYCIPTWFGICHAWAPAALMAEPEREVTTMMLSSKLLTLRVCSRWITTGEQQICFYGVIQPEGHRTR